MRRKRLVVSFRCAFRGIGKLIREEPNARIHLGITLAILGLAFWLQIDRLQWALLIFAIGLVWVAEAFNTAFEWLGSLAARGYSRELGQAKDIAAGAVLIASFIALVLGLIILSPPFFERIFGRGGQ